MPPAPSVSTRPLPSFAELLLRCGLQPDAPASARPRGRPRGDDADSAALAHRATTDAPPFIETLPPPLEQRSPAVEVARASAAPTSAAPAAELQRLADEMLRRATVVELPSEVTLQLELEVPVLHEVGVELRFSEGRLRASLQPADQAGFDRLRGAVPQLEEALVRRGLDAGRVEVRPPRAR